MSVVTSYSSRLIVCAETFKQGGGSSSASGSGKGTGKLILPTELNDRDRKGKVKGVQAAE